MNDITHLLNNFDEDIAELTKSLCDFVKHHCPDAEEKIQLGWKVVTYECNTVFCAVAPHRQWINLQFHHGAHLKDSLGMLEGAGKSMRHVKIRSLEDINSDILTLLTAAIDHDENV